jgi:hypothetical protein
MEPEFSELAIELFGVGFVEEWSFLCKPIDVEVDPALSIVIEAEVPVSNLGLELNLTP